MSRKKGPAGAAAQDAYPPEMKKYIEEVEDLGKTYREAKEKLERAQSDYLASMQGSFKRSARELMKTREKLNKNGAPTMESLSWFCTLVEALVLQQQLSMSEVAGEILGVSPPDLSKRLRNLEKWLKAVHKEPVRLIDRSAGSNKHALTQSGIDFYNKAVEMLKLYDTL